MGMDTFNPNDPHVQLLLAQERLKFEKERRKFENDVGKLEQEIALQKKEIAFLKEAVILKDREIAKKKKRGVFPSLLISIVFLVSTVLFGFGVNLVTSGTLPYLGMGMMLLGFVTYVVATVLAAHFAGGNV